MSTTAENHTRWTYDGTDITVTTTNSDGSEHVKWMKEEAAIPTKRGRGRPKGSKDTKPRKKRTSKISSRPETLVLPTKRARGRPKGSKDTKPRKKRVKKPSKSAGTSAEDLLDSLKTDITGRWGRSKVTVGSPTVLGVKNIQETTGTKNETLRAWSSPPWFHNLRNIMTDSLPERPYTGSTKDKSKMDTFVPM